MKKHYRVIFASALAATTASTTLWSAQQEQSESNAWQEIKGDFKTGVKVGRAEAKILMNPHLNPFNIEVRMVEPDKALLLGTVKSSEQKQLASVLVLEVDGIKDVKNMLKIDPRMETSKLKSTKNALSQKLDDATITARVKAALMSLDDVDSLKINVDTDAGIVTLKGNVESEIEQDLAIHVAKAQSGVHEVKSQLTFQ